MAAFAAEGGRAAELHRVPFFLEPAYSSQPEDWWEPHETRMVRKFGSKEAFERVKVSHRLMPRAAEAGLDGEGWTTENGPFTGLYRNDCNGLNCIEEVQLAAIPLSTDCYDANWWGEFGSKGWSQCNYGYP